MLIAHWSLQSDVVPDDSCFQFYDYIRDSTVIKLDQPLLTGPGPGGTGCCGTTPLDAARVSQLQIVPAGANLVTISAMVRNSFSTPPTWAGGIATAGITGRGHLKTRWKSPSDSVAAYGTISWAITPIALPGEVFTYAAGPIVANSDQNLCRDSGTSVDLATAEGLCSADPECEWLHDADCNGYGWRTCGSKRDNVTNQVVWTATSADTGLACSRLKGPGTEGWHRWTGSMPIAAGSDYEWMDLCLSRTTSSAVPDSSNEAW